jgi:hypothetical protein
MAAHNSMRFYVINNFQTRDNKSNRFVEIEDDIITELFSKFYKDPTVEMKVISFVSKLQTLGSVQTCLHQNDHNLSKF